MNLTTFTFSGSDGLALFGRLWHSQSAKTKGTIYLVHGLGEHSGRYAHLADVVNHAGYHLTSFDLRGHGLSEGKRGHSQGLEQYLHDIDTFIHVTSEKIDSNLPRFLYGHSLGGNFVLYYGIDRTPKLSGIIATGPVLATTSPTPKIKVALAKIMAKLMPGFTLKNGLETEALSRNAAVVKAYKDDVYVHDLISARLGMDLLYSGRYLLENAANWHLPLLLVHGDADRITSPQASQKFAQSANGNVTFNLLPDYYHEIHNDIGADRYFDMLIKWLDQHIGSVN